MSIAEQVFTHALLLAGNVTEPQSKMLEALCGVAVSSLRSRLRDGLTPDDCKADFIAAASLYALAAMSEMDEAGQLEQFTTGDLTLRRSSCDAAACCLRYQAEMMMAPYVKDRFAFRGV